MIAALLTGLGLGLSVAAQVGPVSLLCIRSVLRGGIVPGLAIGLGAALIDVAYAGLGVAGTARLLAAPGLRTWLGLGGAAVLVAMGAWALVTAGRAAAAGAGAGPGLEGAGPLRALRTSLAATASNPLTIGSWAAIFAAASAAGVATGTATTALLLTGVGLGTLGWFTLLSLSLGAVRGRIGERGLRLVDLGAGAALVGFGVLLGWRAVSGG